MAKGSSASHSAVAEVFLLICNPVCVCVGVGVGVYVGGWVVVGVCVRVSHCRQDNPRCRSCLPPHTRQGLSLVCCYAHPSSRPCNPRISPVSTCRLRAPAAELMMRAGPHGSDSTSRHSTSGSQVYGKQFSYLVILPTYLILEFWRQDPGEEKHPEGSRGSSALPGA